MRDVRAELKSEIRKSLATQDFRSLADNLENIFNDIYEEIDSINREPEGEDN